MISISKFQNNLSFSDKDIERALEQSIKSVKSSSGDVIDVNFCSDCGHPVHEDSLFITSTFGAVDPAKVVCGLCYYPLNLDRISHTDPGVLIYAPDLTQEQVNAIALVLYNVKFKENQHQDYLDLVMDIDDLIFRRANILSEFICDGVSSPSIISQFLYMMTEEQYKASYDVFSLIRFFPSESVASRQLAYLKTNILKKYDDKKWVSMIQKIQELKK